MKEFEWADIHPYMTDEEMEEYIRLLEEQCTPDWPEGDSYFYRPL